MTKLNAEQEQMLDLVSRASTLLTVAKAVRTTEIARRVAEATANIRVAVDREIVDHETNLDEAMIAAVNAGVPVRQIAHRGLGARSDMSVHKRVWELREEGRLASDKSVGLQPINLNAPMPEPMDFTALMQPSAPVFEINAEPLVLVEASGDEPAITVPAVSLFMDNRDPWFAAIAANARQGTQFRGARFCTLYRNPGDGKIVAAESKERGDTLWDHPVARWAKVHAAEVEAQFAALGI